MHTDRDNKSRDTVIAFESRSVLTDDAIYWGERELLVYSESEPRAQSADNAHNFAVTPAGGRKSPFASARHRKNTLRGPINHAATAQCTKFSLQSRIRAGAGAEQVSLATF